MNNPKSQPEILIHNIRIFDGKNDGLISGRSLHITGDLITRIPDEIPPLSREITRIDGQGMTLIPGMIDSHVHISLASLDPFDLFNGDVGYLHIRAAKSAEQMLCNGFTSVRDAGGFVFGIKRSIDEGLIPGPRIFPSGAMICQTSGHFDYRRAPEIPVRSGGVLSRPELLGLSVIADGVPDVLAGTRNQLRLGASQIKIATSGGVSSRSDPLDVVEFGQDEIRAAVEAAEQFNTYVMAHAVNDQSVRNALSGGVKSIEHALMADEDTIRLIARQRAWLCAQAFMDGDCYFMDPVRKEKFDHAIEGTARTFLWAKKYEVNLTWGSDVFLIEKEGKEQIKSLMRLLNWFSPVDILRMVTSRAGALLSLSGKRNPYPGKIGVIEEGAYADLLLVNGNPLEDVSLLSDPDKNLVMIMKGGKIVRNLLSSPDS